MYEPAAKIYKIQVLPYFDQGDIIIVNMDAYIEDVVKLQKLQNRVLRICLNENNRQHISNIHNRTKIPLLCDKHTYCLSIYVYSRTKQTKYIDKKPIRTRRRNAPILNPIFVWKLRSIGHPTRMKLTQKT